jgi:hypothetical protein
MFTLHNMIYIFIYLYLKQRHARPNAHARLRALFLIKVTLRQNLTWPNIKKDVDAAVRNCHACQIVKKVRKKYGELPDKLAERPIAWNRVDVDLIGPLTIKTPSGNK